MAPEAAAEAALRNITQPWTQKLVGEGLGGLFTACTPAIGAQRQNIGKQQRALHTGDL